MPYAHARLNPNRYSRLSFLVCSKRFETRSALLIASSSDPLSSFSFFFFYRNPPIDICGFSINCWERVRGKLRRVTTIARYLNMFDTEKFIEEIQKRPAIYDVNRSEYNDRDAKMIAWDEVCQVMVPNWARLTDEERNVEEKSLRGKWRNIRDYFMKELKLQKSPKLGAAGRKRKKYMYFDQLLFLMPMVENKRSAGTTLGNCKSEESEGEVDNPVIEEYDVPLAQAAPGAREYLQPGASYKICPRYPKQLCETTFASFDNEFHDILSSHSSQRVAYDEDDYDKMFLLSLLPIIRQVPEEKKLDVRIQMQQILAMALRPTDNK